MMASKSKTGFKITQGMPIPLGVTIVSGGFNFAVAVPNEQECRLNLYDKITGELVETILLTEKHKTGNVFSVIIKNVNIQSLSYMYQLKEKEFIDPYVKSIYGRENYGKLLTLEEKSLIRGGFSTSSFDWQERQALQLPYAELIIYKMNVRGFTKHTSSQVKDKGTFLGVIEKMSYLKELGINCVQLMPIYEYNEIIEYKGMIDAYKINYWGYSGENAYFAPKVSYAADPSNVVQELKTMVNLLHKNGIEIIMEMNFTSGTNPGLIQDCLRYWSFEYKIDGFKLNSAVVPTTVLATDPILSTTKMLAAGWDISQIYEKDFEPIFKNLAEYNDGYSVDVKRFLKADEEQVGPFASRLKRNPDKCSVVNYITNHDGFTMRDLYSYDVKHNEANGENNNDGTEYNYSWNCGAEGNTKKKKVLDLRKKQIRNAFIALMFSQGTPMFLAGDEFGNTQFGNNNAYCQDNEIAWLNWNLLKTNIDTFTFIKQLIQIRKEHPILHLEHQLRNMDYISCGFPDLSYHGIKAWYPDFSHYSRMLGVMLSGNYAKINRIQNDQNFYFAYNMHWEKHEFDLPKLPVGMKWYVLLDTANQTIGTDMQLSKNQRQYEVVARAVVVLIGK